MTIVIDWFIVKMTIVLLMLVGLFVGVFAAGTPIPITPDIQFVLGSGFVGVWLSAYLTHRQNPGKYR